VRVFVFLDASPSSLLSGMMTGTSLDHSSSSPPRQSPLRLQQVIAQAQATAMPGVGAGMGHTRRISLTSAPQPPGSPTLPQAQAQGQRQSLLLQQRSSVHGKYASQLTSTAASPPRTTSDVLQQQLNPSSHHHHHHSHPHKAMITIADRFILPSRSATSTPGVTTATSSSGGGSGQESPTSRPSTSPPREIPASGGGGLGGSPSQHHQHHKRISSGQRDSGAMGPPALPPHLRSHLQQPLQIQSFVSTSAIPTTTTTSALHEQAQAGLGIERPASGPIPFSSYPSGGVGVGHMRRESSSVSRGRAGLAMGSYGSGSTGSGGSGSVMSVSAFSGGTPGSPPTSVGGGSPLSDDGGILSPGGGAGTGSVPSSLRRELAAMGMGESTASSVGAGGGGGGGGGGTGGIREMMRIPTSSIPGTTGIAAAAAAAAGISAGAGAVGRQGPYPTSAADIPQSSTSGASAATGTASQGVPVPPRKRYSSSFGHRYGSAGSVGADYDLVTEEGEEEEDDIHAFVHDLKAASAATRRNLSGGGSPHSPLSPNHPYSPHSPSYAISGSGSDSGSGAGPPARSQTTSLRYSGSSPLSSSPLPREAPVTAGKSAAEREQRERERQRTSSGLGSTDAVPPSPLERGSALPPTSTGKGEMFVISPHTTTGTASSPLALASSKGDAAMVRLLLDAGANPDGRALRVASQAGYIDIVRMLVDAGADPNSGDDEGITAIHLASEGHQKEVIQLLLEAGAIVPHKSRYVMLVI
jgi:hypothetical protein